MKRLIFHSMAIAGVAGAMAAVGAYFGSPVGMNNYLSTRDYTYSPESKERAQLAANYTASTSALYAAVAAGVGTIATSLILAAMRSEEEQVAAFAERKLQQPSLPANESAVWMDVAALAKRKADN